MCMMKSLTCRRSQSAMALIMIRQKQNTNTVNWSHLVSLTTLLPISQCGRGDDLPIDISIAEQCNIPGSLIPACLTPSLCNLHPSLHTAPIMF